MCRRKKEEANKVSNQTKKKHEYFVNMQPIIRGRTTLKVHGGTITGPPAKDLQERGSQGREPGIHKAKSRS
jgi:hypothetical protein